MKSKNLSVVYKIFFALLGFSAVVTEIATTVERGTFTASNFFSYFTIESNIFAVVVLLLSALVVASGKSFKNLDLLRGASTLYMVTTGIVFSVLLSGLDPAVLTAVPWDNVVLHYIMPVAVLVDWLLDPPQRRIRLQSALVWLVFPLLYVAYTLVRGAYVGWYPYPFLNPGLGGYGRIVLVSVGLTLFALAVCWLLTRLPLRLKTKR